MPKTHIQKSSKAVLPCPDCSIENSHARVYSVPGTTDWYCPTCHNYFELGAKQ